MQIPVPSIHDARHQMYNEMTFKRPLFTARCVAPTPTGSWSGKYSDHVLALMRHFGIRQAFVPHVAAFSGRIANGNEFTTTTFDESWHIRHAENPCEGAAVGLGEALMAGAAGCMFVAAYDTRTQMCPPRMIFAHAGRDSLVDRSRINGGTPRQYEGVLHSIAEAFAWWGVPPGHISIESFFSIDPKVFLHPFEDPEDEEGAKKNRALYRDIHRHWGEKAAYETRMPDGRPAAAIDLPELMSAQARILGFGSSSHEGYLPIAEGFPHTRHSDPSLRGKRSMIILHRH